jgi:3-hydroxymyristoyl/3-hydroxydecanoyl-(acyl carrier protein) dehydratase
VNAVTASAAQGDACLNALAARVRDHEWVADAVPASGTHLDGAAILLVAPSIRGLRQLRAHGKRSLVETWRTWAGESIAGPIEWRLERDLQRPQSSDARRRSLPVVSVCVPTAPGTLRCNLAVPLDLAVFEGHFDAMPIVPGVLQIGWMIELAASHLGTPDQLRAIASAKFQRLVQPGMDVSVLLAWDPARNELRFDWQSGATRVSAARLVLQDSGNG